MEKRILYIVVALLYFSSIDLQAKHIIGGDMAYVCLGNGLYHITMNIYRDCSDPEGAEFDPIASFGIFRREANGSYTNISPFDPIVERDALKIPLLTEFPLIPDISNPCLTIPDDICVEQGIYEFDIRLPVINQSYVITYQRCCRNVTINNIRNPEDSGATYSIEISAVAQQVCNNSPIFNGFPPIVICQGEDINFDHSVSDIEGDSVAYTFCTPLLGGGTAGTPDNPNGQSWWPNGVAPDPPASPPYQGVNFVIPAFSATNPMGGSPRVTIDPLTGLISGVPELLGQYVVGVCVEEYRNGQLLSLTRRDFQFNVENCQPTVVAEIQNDVQIGDKEFIINSCGNNTVSFVNQSFQEQNIFSYLWKFDILGRLDSFMTKNVTVTFPDTGQYQGIMVANPGTQCADTANIFVNIFPEIDAEFEFQYDTCVAGPVVFTDQSTSDANIVSWSWDFADGNLTSDRHPIHEYLIPGDFPVNLSVVADNGCEDDVTHNVEYFPVPALVVVDPSTFLGCAPESVFFNNLSFPIDSTYTIVWDFGDGGSSSEISPTYTYEDPGVYTVSLSITSPIGCSTSIVYSNWVTVRPSPMAGFSFTPEDPNSIKNDVQFFNESSGHDRIFWQFGTFGSSLRENPRVIFPDTGMFTIQLVAQHISGCLDTAIQVIDIEPIVTYFMPNAFTPNEDGTNDSFKGEGVLDGAKGFSMTIWNRWGEMIFETDNPDIGWNGRKNNTGDYLIPGVYLYVVNYLGPRGEEVELKGFSTLVR